MSAVVFILLIGAIGSILVGILSSILTLLPPRRNADKEKDPFTSIYWSYTLWSGVLGVFMILAPEDFYGPSWHYFSEVPHDGTGMGICLVSLSALVLIVLWRRGGDRMLATLLFLLGFVYWTSGLILGAEGLASHEGLMPAPLHDVHRRAARGAQHRTSGASQSGTEQMNSYLIPIIVAIITSLGGSGVLQMVLTRRQRKAEEEKKKRDDEREKERLKRAEEKEREKERELRAQLDEEKRQTLSEAQISAQEADRPPRTSATASSARTTRSSTSG